MAVVREFTLPDLGEGLTGAEVVRWMVEVGEVIAIDQPVVEVETAKAVVEVPCPYGGVVTARFGEVGEEVPVGAPLVTVAVSVASSDDAEPAPERPLVGYGVAEGGKGARRRRVVAGNGAARAAAPAVAPVAPAAVAAPAAPAVPAVVAVISPLVRRMAREHGIDLAGVAGSGPDGLIMRRDVERVVAAPAQAAPAPVAAAVSRETVADEIVPLRGLRKTIAEKLTRSHQEIPAATCWVDADATGLMELRQQLNRAAGPKVSVLALLARICTAALERFPELNSSVGPEGIRRHSAVHLGFAAQSERGLVVPVVRDAQLMGTEQLTTELARLTEAARAGSLTPGELTGGTFTLNNYGVFGVDGSTPILNHPEAAMLGVGRITPKPWVHEGQLAVRQVTQLSFTFDHRVCDGGTAGGFLRFVADCVEQPGLLLRRL
ncbi:2-oxo acid dehydrogenase subunit E2 [Kitasatospora paracochleata]|uniref:Dihydrolipoamide acetyltransferase component of pyruvate dehydrogenase complex n=1 Tax=Kitasatospora paracochleata TaxID=58354 RepID=A0ABT1J720_9ACTN|nr:dihydrolipoamide acetyltransferase family protein [Kitasatospora paracochleata]MCP2313232.1 pyruvate dehydrogenase E2 component (dihydrolipoamide acetyltransferase) [Kitasatospora paracochleata]